MNNCKNNAGYLVSFNFTKDVVFFNLIADLFVPSYVSFADTFSKRWYGYIFQFPWL